MEPLPGIDPIDAEIQCMFQIGAVKDPDHHIRLKFRDIIIGFIEYFMYLHDHIYTAIFDTISAA